MRTFADIPGQRRGRAQQLPPIPTAVIAPKGDPYQVAHHLQQHAAQTYAGYRDAIPSEVDADQALLARGDFGSAPSVLALQPALDAADQDYQAAVRAVQDLIGEFTVAPTADAQQTAQRYIARVEKQLDGLSPGQAADAIQRIISDASEDQLRALVEDLPLIGAKLNVPTDVINGFLADAIPGVSDASAEAQAKGRKLAVLRGNHASLSRAVKAGVSGAPLHDPADFA